jgi:aminoglycoside 3-N-acetyltransferase
MTRFDRDTVRHLKQRLKPAYFGAQRLITRTLFAYSPVDLQGALRTLGLERGDAVFVHSAFRRSSGFAGTAGDVIDSLLQVVGDEGHVLMMSIPYRGSSQRYAESRAVFDVARTPSAVGLISEVFRRRPGVLRSASPLHPVLACGRLAAWLIADHEKCAYSCGRGSPFERFLGMAGKFLFFDAPFSSLTFMHYVEDTFRQQLPVDLYDAQPALVRIKDAAGRELDVRQFVFSEAARARRHFGVVHDALAGEDAFRSVRVGNSRVLCVNARAVVDCAARLVQQGTGFYR